MEHYFYKLGQQHALATFEKNALSVSPRAQGALKRFGQGAAVNAVPGMLVGSQMSDDHPVRDALIGGGFSGLIGGVSGVGMGHAMEGLYGKTVEGVTAPYMKAPFAARLNALALKDIEAAKSKGLYGIGKDLSDLTTHDSALQHFIDSEIEKLKTRA